MIKHKCCSALSFEMPSYQEYNLSRKAKYIQQDLHCLCVMLQYFSQQVTFLRQHLLLGFGRWPERKRKSNMKFKSKSLSSAWVSQTPETDLWGGWRPHGSPVYSRIASHCWEVMARQILKCLFILVVRNFDLISYFLPHFSKKWTFRNLRAILQLVA